MKKKLQNICLALVVAVILLLSATTFFEKYRGTDWAFSHVYGSVWFTVMWILLVVAALFLLLLRRVFLRPAVLCLHFSFVVILSGALLTRLTAHDGVIHLKEGIPTSDYLTGKKEKAHLPFTVTLTRFAIDYYPGTHAPSDFISEIDIRPFSGNVASYRISMNRIAVYEGWRFYQSSFDEDGRGSWLSLSRDIYGIPVTYAGYFLMFLSFVWLLFDPQGRFRQLVRHLSLTKLAMVPFFLLVTGNLYATPTTLSSRSAEEFGTIQVLFNDRIAPVQTLSINFTRKLTGRDFYGDFTPEQVFTGWLFFPQEWQFEPMIRIKNKELRRLLGLNEYAAFADFFDSERQYRLEPYCMRAYRDGSQDAFSRAVREVDEKVQLVIMQQSGEMLPVFPFEIDGRMVWRSPVSELPVGVDTVVAQVVHGIFPLMYSAIKDNDAAALHDAIDGLKRFQHKMGGETVLSDSRITIEKLYNALPFATILSRLNLIVGLIAFAFYLWCSACQGKCRRNRQAIECIFIGWQVISLLLLSFVIVLRTVISGRLPFGNGYETMLSMAWFVLLFASVFWRRFKWVLPFGLLLSGFSLLISHINQMNPQITPLMPVLSSPLLSLHVSCIMAAYALLSFTFLNSLSVYFIRCFSSDSDICHIQAVFSRFLLYPALCLLSLGIFIGAVWANVSWGAYWSWDPKEVWALITLLLYMLPVHTGWLPAFSRDKVLHLYLLGAFFTVLMTYFGVNYFLGGMHSYAG